MKYFWDCVITIILVFVWFFVGLPCMCLGTVAYAAVTGFKIGFNKAGTLWIE